MVVVVDVEAAQLGVSLAEVRTGVTPAGRSVAAPWPGPFLDPGTLTPEERSRIIDGIERILDGVYTHLPLKRARYGVDPIQRLRILRTQAESLTDDGFHSALADVLTQLRDAHTRYLGPSSLAGKVAALPFLIELCGPADRPTYLVTKVAPGLDPDFQPGVVVEHWNGVPVDRAVQRHGDREVGGRPDSQRAWAVQSLTMRALRYGPPPDEHWVVIGYRTVGERGEYREVTLQWRVVDPDELLAPSDDDVDGSPPGPAAALGRDLALAVDPAAEAVRRARILLFAPAVLVAERSASHQGGRGDGPTPEPRTAAGSSRVVPTTMPRTLKAMAVDGPDGPCGYLRIYAFDAVPDRFVAELRRILPQLPQRGLVVDVRSNPGGYIRAAERALQLFTPNRIEPARFSVLATPFTRALALGPLADELAPWRRSLQDAVRNGELYSQALPITSRDEANDLGQHYAGPVVLIADATTYSSGDLFSAGFLDNGIGPFLCVGTATGAGGANVSDYDSLRARLVASTMSLPELPDGIGLSFSYRRATRAGPSEGRPIEDVGIEGTPYGLTPDDLLGGNRDLIAHGIDLLRRQPRSQLSCTVDRAAGTLELTTDGLDLVDVLFDGHPGCSLPVTAATADATAPGTTDGSVGGAVSGRLRVPYPAGARTATVVGFEAGALRQRRIVGLG